jgi:hypothetical protein
MKSREPTDSLPGIDALRSELEVLNQEALRRDDEVRVKEREEREEQLRLAAESEAAAKQELSRWLLCERFGLVVMGVGVAFGILLTFLPAAPGKIVLYGCALICVLLGARQKDQAQKRIAAILPMLSAEDLVRLRAKKW